MDFRKQESAQPLRGIWGLLGQVAQGQACPQAPQPFLGGIKVPTQSSRDRDRCGLAEPGASRWAEVEVPAGPQTRVPRLGRKRLRQLSPPSPAGDSLPPLLASAPQPGPAPGTPPGVTLAAATVPPTRTLSLRPVPASQARAVSVWAAAPSPPPPHPSSFLPSSLPALPSPPPRSPPPLASLPPLSELQAPRSLPPPSSSLLPSPPRRLPSPPGPQICASPPPPLLHP